MLCDWVHNSWIAFCTSGKHTRTEKAPFKRESSNNNQPQTTPQNKQQQTTTTNNNSGKLFSFLFIYLSRETLTNASLHSITDIKVRNNFCNCWLFLPNSPSSNTKIRKMMRWRNNTTTQKKTTQVATMVSGIIFSCSIIKIKTHTLTCVWKQKKKRYVPLFLLLIVVLLSHVVSKPPKSPINTTRHNKTQKATKQR